MKRVLSLLCLILLVTLSSCGYSKDDLIEAKNEGYQEGFEEGYDLAQYEAKGELERAKYEAMGELERAKEEYSNNAYEAGYDMGYDIGYEDGYYDCLVEYGLIDNEVEPDYFPRIEKDKD